MPNVNIPNPLNPKPPISFVAPGYHVDLDRIPPSGGAGFFKTLGLIAVFLAVLGGIVYLVIWYMGGRNAPTEEQITQVPALAEEVVTETPSSTPTQAPTNTATLDDWSLTGTALFFSTASPTPSSTATADYCGWLTPTPTPTATWAFTPDAWQATGTAVFYQTRTSTPRPSASPTTPRIWCDFQTPTFTPFPLGGPTTTLRARIPATPTLGARPNVSSGGSLPTTTLFPTLAELGQPPAQVPAQNPPAQPPAQQPPVVHTVIVRQTVLAESTEEVTATATATLTETPSSTPTETPSATATATLTATATATPSETPTETPSATATATPTETPSSTPTETPSATATNTPTPSSTATNTPTATATPFPALAIAAGDCNSGFPAFLVFNGGAPLQWVQWDIQLDGVVANNGTWLTDDLLPGAYAGAAAPGWAGVPGGYVLTIYQNWDGATQTALVICEAPPTELPTEIPTGVPTEPAPESEAE